MNSLLKDAIWFYLIFMASVGTFSLLLIALAVRDYWKCRRVQMESKNKTFNSGSVGDLGNNDATI